MSLTYGFYNSQNGDRVYSTSQISDFLDGLIVDGIYANVSDGTNHGFQVVEQPTPTMAVNVSVGKAWLNKTWTYIDTAYPVTISAASALLSRIDAIVLTINKTRSSRSNYIEVIEGTPASSPEKPTVEDDTNIYRYVLAWVTVGVGVTEITQANIESNINVTNGIPFVTLPSILGDTYPTTNELLAQYKAEFDDWFDYMKGQLTTDAAGALQTEIDDMQDEIDTIAPDGVVDVAHGGTGKSSITSGSVLVGNGTSAMTERAIDTTSGGTADSSSLITSGAVRSIVTSMQSTFQDGVDAVYNACVAEVVTPSASTPTAIASAIAEIRDGGTAAASQILTGYSAYAAKSLISGSMTNKGAWTGTGTPSGNNTVNVTIPAGYHNGSGYVTANGATSYSAGRTQGRADANSIVIYYSIRDYDGYCWVRVRVLNPGASSTVDIINYSGSSIESSFAKNVSYSGGLT